MISSWHAKVLIVEDEKPIARFLELELKHEGYQPVVVHDGLEAVKVAREGDWDVVILDIMLPGLDGLEVCRRIRQFSHMPIIMVTAKDALSDKIAGLDTGADDYITKPFAIEELLARLRAVMRRKGAQSDDPAATKLKAGDVVMNPLTRKVQAGGKEVELTKREFDLLKLFLENKNIVLTRDIIIKKVWGYDFFGETNIVDVYVRYLRAKIDDPGKDSLIQTIRGVGYILKG
jgi:two-component system response regulator ArlR